MNRSFIIGIVGILLLSGFVVIGSEDSSAASYQNVFAKNNYGTVDNPITSFYTSNSYKYDYTIYDFVSCLNQKNLDIYVFLNTTLSLVRPNKLFNTIDSVSPEIPGFVFIDNSLYGGVREPTASVGEYKYNPGIFSEIGTYTIVIKTLSTTYTVNFIVVGFEYTSIPTVSNIVSPVYSYTDDGDPFIPSDDGQILNSSASYPVLGSSATLGADKWIDPNYRDPPSADHVITVTAPLKFKSNDPAYTLRWINTEVSGVSDVNGARSFAWIAGNSKAYLAGGNDFKMSTGGIAPCLPSWITYDSGSPNPYGYSEIGWFDIIIRPALQQVSEDTHGDYWMYFETESPGKESWLIKLSVDVEWAGGVIVPEKYNEFILSYDYGIGGEGNFSYRQIVSDSSKSYEFVVLSTAPIRSGYEFRGWPINPGSEYSDIGEVFVLSASTPGVSVKSVDNKTTYEKTIYGVWKSTGSEPVPLPNFLEELLELLRNPVVMGGFLVFVFLSAFIVRSRRI